MEILKLMLITLVFVIMAVGALSVRLFFVRGGKFSGGSCRSAPGLEQKGIKCGCGNKKPCNETVTS